MGLKTRMGTPVVESVELGKTHGGAVYVSWRNLGELLRNEHRMEPTEGVGGIRVDEHGIHVFFGDSARGDKLL